MHIYVAYSRPIGWTDWADFFVDTHGLPGGGREIGKTN